MAERSNSKQELAQGVDALQKRGRRRLVGAIALVFLAVIVLPMVFDPEPRHDAPPVSVRIPGENDTKFTPKVTPVAPAAPSAGVQSVTQEKHPVPRVTVPPSPPAPAKEVTQAQAAPGKAPAPVVEAAKHGGKSVSRTPEKDAPSAHATGAEQFIVQVGAFSSADKVKEITDKLKDARLVHYTEPVATAGGQVIRIRLGPYASKDAAEKARERAKSLGMSPSGAVSK